MENSRKRKKLDVGVASAATATLKMRRKGNLDRANEQNYPRYLHPTKGWRNTNVNRDTATRVNQTYSWPYSLKAYQAWCKRGGYV